MSKVHNSPLTLNDKTGLYESRITLPSINGERRRLVKRSKDKRALERYHREKLAELDKYGDLPSSSPTLEKYLNGWLDEKARHARPNTMTNYRSVVRKHIIPTIGKKRLAHLTPADVKKLHKAVLDHGGASNYALNVHRVLSTALADAVEEGTILTNPAKRVRAPKKGKPKLEAFTLDEALQFMAHLTTERDGARWATAILTGARRGEVIGLEVDRVGASLDLSWQLQRIAYKHGCGDTCGRKYGGDCPKREMADVPPDYEYRHVTGGLYLTRPKSEDGERVIPLVEPLKSILERHLEASPPNQFVFPRQDGLPHDPSRDTAEFRAVLKRSGIEKNVRLHDLRHVAVLLLRAAGVDWDIIRMILGHSTIMQTMAYLPAAEANDPRLLAAMEALESHLTLRTLERAS